MELDPTKLSMTEIIRLQTLLSQELTRRFEVSAALAFTDIVGSTAYFARYGDEAGKQLQVLHLDLLEQCLTEHGGRIVDTAGDGAFAVFPGQAAAGTAADAMTALLQRVSTENEGRAREHQLTLRIGLHWGRVLSDGVQVTGDAVNLCARIAASAEPGQIHLSRELFQELGSAQRLSCRPLGAVALKGAGRSVELLSLAWRDASRFPATVLVRESGQLIALPAQDIIAFGRLELIEGMHANDVVLALPDATATRQISRWHFELRRLREGFNLRSVSSQATLVDGQPLSHGQELPIRPGSVVQLAGVMTLEFLAERHGLERRDDTTHYLSSRTKP
jgi:class 3 adenylate cyclase